MKRFLKKIGVIIALVLCVMLFNVIIDPYNVFHYKKVRSNGIEPNRNYIKTQYILDHKDKYDSFVFGSSRVGFIDVMQLPGGNYYNMTYSGGYLHENLETLQTFIKNGVPIKNILLGVGDESYLDRSEHQQLAIQRPFPTGNTFDFYKSYLFDTFTTIRAIPTMIKAKSDDMTSVKDLYTTGDYNASDLRLSESGYLYKTMNYECSLADSDKYIIDQSIDDLKEIIRLCKENDINLTIYTHLLHYLTYGNGLKRGYMDFLEKLSETTEFYNFTGLNELALSDENFYDWSHYTKDISNQIIQAIYSHKVDKHLEKQGFGMYVTKENREEYLSILKEQIQQKVGPGKETEISK